MSNTEVDIEEVKRLDRAWNAAYERRDLAALSEILANDWVGLMPDHQIITKEMLVEAQRQAPPPEEVESTFAEGALHLFGQTAVTTGQVSIKTAENFVQQGFTRVYAKRDGRWQAVAVQVVAL